ncbi:hypothetical protein LYNGBM3L_51490 [Moorena producens 3L]|uniref:Uncharacterized protein n=1 Tax=Moorena producens 3L TaxID=489825 RepID=F4XYB0_9CYAN|nr:hypothetical protein LYNGBM3L_51490 [Moorena producens 3L]OLT67654.1 hypothetical protein BI334_23825 [Moorena producens 3L]
MLISKVDGVADYGYDYAPLALQFWVEQNFLSSPKVGVLYLGGFTKTIRSKFILEFSNVKFLILVGYKNSYLRKKYESHS